MKAINKTLALLLCFATWILISASAYLSDMDFTAVFIDALIAPLAAFVLYFHVIKIDIENEEQ